MVIVGRYLEQYQPWRKWLLWRGILVGGLRGLIYLQKIALWGILLLLSERLFIYYFNIHYSWNETTP